MDQLAALILAAGKGSRMNSDMPKVLHSVGRKPLLGHVISLTKSLQIAKLAIVTGHKSELIDMYIKEQKIDAKCLKQARQLGTADAVKCTEKYFQNFQGYMLVLYGDVPFIKENTITKMLKILKTGADLAVLGFNKSVPTGYGRLVVNSKGYLQKIIEEKSTNKAQKKITLCNSGVFCGEADKIFSLVSKIGNNNSSKEYFLTDIFELATAQGLNTAIIECTEGEAKGVNSRNDLAEAEIYFQNRLRNEALNKGVTLLDPSTIYLSHDTNLEADIVIHPNVVFGENVEIKSGVEIFSFSHLEGCKIFGGAKIGPFARVRPKSIIKQSVKIGNFVEVKNSKLGVDSKANHLSYIGDAEVGDESNIGAGTVFCNYNGVSKNITEVGKNSFIGSNSSLIAPLSIGSNTIVGAGSVITANIPDNALSLSRQKQKTVPQIGKRKLQAKSQTSNHKKD